MKRKMQSRRNEGKRAGPHENSAGSVATGESGCDAATLVEYELA